MSSTSSGEYSPVELRRDAIFNQTLPWPTNSTELKRAQNRQFEILLFYWRTAEIARPRMAVRLMQ